MTTTPLGAASVRLARPGPIAQISSGSSPCCAGVEIGHSSDMAAGAPHSAGVSALAAAATKPTQNAATVIKRIPNPPRADVDGEWYGIKHVVRMSRFWIMCALGFRVPQNGGNGARLCENRDAELDREIS